MDVIPNVYQLALLALVSYRVWRLSAEDEILERPRRWLVRLPQDWDEENPIPRAYRDRVASFITCPWCLGFWVSLGSYIAWMFTLGDTPNNASEVFVAIAVWFALSSIVGIIRSKLDPPDTG